MRTDKESNKGSSSASTHTARESDKGSSADKERVQGSSSANLASSGMYSKKSDKGGQDNWGDRSDEDDLKEDKKFFNEDDYVTTDESEDENGVEAEAAEARKRRSDSIVNVSSASVPKEGVKGPGCASEAEDMEDETQGSSSEPKEIVKGSEASSESKEAPQALSAEEIEENLHRERIARGREVHERLRAKSISNDDWASLSATFDRAANAPGAYQRTFNNDQEDVTKEPSPLFTQIMDKFKKAKPTAVPRIPLDQRLVDPSSLEKEESLESVPSPARTGNPDDPKDDAEMQVGDNQDATSAAKNLDGESSSASAVDENLFIDRLVKLASNGEFSTHEEVLDVYLFAFGERTLKNVRQKQKWNRQEK